MSFACLLGVHKDSCRGHATLGDGPRSLRPGARDTQAPVSGSPLGRSYVVPLAREIPGRSPCHGGQPFVFLLQTSANPDLPVFFVSLVFKIEALKESEAPCHLWSQPCRKTTAHTQGGSKASPKGQGAEKAIGDGKVPTVVRGEDPRALRAVHRHWVWVAKPAHLCHVLTPCCPSCSSLNSLPPPSPSGVPSPLLGTPLPQLSRVIAGLLRTRFIAC